MLTVTLQETLNIQPEEISEGEFINMNEENDSDK